MDLVVEGVHCGACISTIEKGLGREAGVRGARVNLASKRVTVEWNDGALRAGGDSRPAQRPRLPRLSLRRANALDSVEAAEEKRLLRCLGVAAFGAMNVMLISVALWSGAADASGWATRDFFHWLSALVVLPTVAYAGRPFFDSAMRALRQATFNMDVPITIGVMLALIAFGRADAAARARDLFRQRGHAADVPARRPLSRPAHAAAHARRRDQSGGDQGGEGDQARRRRRGASKRRSRRIAPGDLVLARAGDRVAVDGMVEDGRSEIDQSLVTGETAAIAVAPRRVRLRRHAQPHRRAARARQQRRRRHAARRSQHAARNARSSSARPTCGSPTAPRASTRRSCI